MRFVRMPFRVWRRTMPPVPIDSSSGWAITTSRPPFCSSIDESGYAVFHLPRVVEGVPGGSPHRVDDRPLLFAVWLRKALEKRLAVRLLEPETDPLRVLQLSAQHVLEHLVPVPAAAARSFAQPLRRLGPDAVEVFPAGVHERDHSPGLSGAHAPGLVLRRYARRAEVGRRIARKSLDHLESRRILRELDLRELGHARIARRVSGQRLERGRLIPAPPGPPGPVGGAGESPLGAPLDVDARRGHAVPSSLRPRRG